MKRALLGLLLLLALTAPGGASAATPVPWCGTDVSATDRFPDVTPGFAIHVIYAYPAGTPNRFAQLAPRFVGDATAIDAWWRVQDAGRTLRFDLATFPCTSPFGALDISLVELPASVGAIGSAFNTIASLLFTGGFEDSTKRYLVYFDGSTAQSGPERVCGQGASGGTDDNPGFAVIYLDSCGAADDDVLRPVVVTHELMHVLGAVAGSAPHVCRSGHVCDAPNDLMTAFLSGSALETLALDVGRDDYYGHSGNWLDLQDSIVLERLDSPDRLPPSAVPGLTATGSEFGNVVVTWGQATDDVAVAGYRVTVDDRFVGTTKALSSRTFGAKGGTVKVSIRAVDAVGHLGPPATIFYKVGLGLVDAQGTLVRDTVPPSAIGATKVAKAVAKVTLSWKPARDLGGLRGYRVKLGSKTITVTRPTIALNRKTLKTNVVVSAVDRAGNTGPPTLVPLRRLR